MMMMMRMMMMENGKTEADATRERNKIDFILLLLHHGPDLFESFAAFAEYLAPYIAAAD